jgi:hypothetical protein
LNHHINVSVKHQEEVTRLKNDELNEENKDEIKVYEDNNLYDDSISNDELELLNNY